MWTKDWLNSKSFSLSQATSCSENTSIVALFFTEEWNGPSPDTSYSVPCLLDGVYTHLAVTMSQSPGRCNLHKPSDTCMYHYPSIALCHTWEKSHNWVRKCFKVILVPTSRRKIAEAQTMGLMNQVLTILESKLKAIILALVSEKVDCMPSPHPVRWFLPCPVRGHAVVERRGVVQSTGSGIRQPVFKTQNLPPCDFEAKGSEPQVHPVKWRPVTVPSLRAC